MLHLSIDRKRPLLPNIGLIPNNAGDFRQVFDAHRPERPDAGVRPDVSEVRLQNRTHRLRIKHGRKGRERRIRGEEVKKEPVLREELDEALRIERVAVSMLEHPTNTVAILFAVRIIEERFGPDQRTNLRSPRQFQLRFVNIPEDSRGLKPPARRGPDLLNGDRGQYRVDDLIGQERGHDVRLGHRLDRRVGRAHIPPFNSLRTFTPDQRKSRRAARNPTASHQPYRRNLDRISRRLMYAAASRAIRPAMPPVAAGDDSARFSRPCPVVARVPTCAAAAPAPTSPVVSVTVPPPPAPPAPTEPVVSMTVPPAIVDWVELTPVPAAPVAFVDWVELTPVPAAPVAFVDWVELTPVPAAPVAFVDWVELTPVPAAPVAFVDWVEPWPVPAPPVCCPLDCPEPAPVPAPPVGCPLDCPEPAPVPAPPVGCPLDWPEPAPVPAPPVCCPLDCPEPAPVPAAPV